MLLLSPIFIFTVLLLLWTQGQPIFLRHERLGRHGRRFKCLKFRTMVRDADSILEAHLLNDPAARAEWATTRKLRNDPRVTDIGRILRKSSMDELPQLLNIIRGEMSVVGPRPIVREEVDFYGQHIDDYYRVRPGLTGLWQISGRSDVSYNSRVNLDMKYISTAGFRQDIKIIARTFVAVTRGTGSY